MKASELETILPKKKRSVADLSRFLSNRAQDNPNYCFLLGAGASVTSGIRSAGELVNSWRAEIYKISRQIDESSEIDAEAAKNWLVENCSGWYDVENEYASLFERKYDLPSQRRMFVEQEVDGAIPSIGYAYLTNLVKANFTNTIFTTNFDDLLNEAFFRFTDIRPYVCAHDSSVKGITITSKRPKIIKLHGDYLFDDIKCTNESTATLETNMSDKLQQFLREFGLIVCGYSGCDKSIMDTLNRLISDEAFLRHGIYWCLRPGDDIQKPLLNFLKKDKVYFCLTEGFDELFAEINQNCCSGDISFFDTSVSTKSLNYSDSWLKSKWLNSSRSKLIRGHLNEIEKYRKNSNFAHALTRLRSEEDRDEIKKEKLTDEEIILLIEIERLIDRSKFKQAERKIDGCISTTHNVKFREQLLKMGYGVFRQLGELNKAKTACDELIRIDPKNPTYSVWKSRIEFDFKIKIQDIKEAIAKDPYYWLGYHELAQVELRAIKLRALNATFEAMEEIEQNYSTSIDRRPALGNPSWKMLFEFLIEHEKIRKEEKLIFLLEMLQKQDKYNPSVVDLAFQYCKHIENHKINHAAIEGGDLFSYLNKAVECSYPNDSYDFWETIVNSSIEFKNHSFAKKFHQRYLDLDLQGDLESFHAAMADYYLDIERDASKALRYLEEKISESDSPKLLIKYICLLINCNDVTNARKEFERHSHILEHQSKITTEVAILSAERKCGVAIERLSTLSDDPYFKIKYSTEISYSYLVSGEYQKAYDYCNDIISSTQLSEDQHPMRVNYEFARLKIGKKVNKTKLDELIKTSHRKDIQAVCHLLIGDKDKCLEILVNQADKKQSKLLEYLKWPVLESIKSELMSRFSFEVPITAVKTA